MQVTTEEHTTGTYGSKSISYTSVITVPSTGDTLREPRLRIDITSTAGGMPNHVFLAENQPARRMLGVCGVADIQDFPEDAPSATPGLPDFYRVAFFDKVVCSPNAAAEAIDHIKRRLDLLVRNWVQLNMDNSIRV